MSHSRGSSVTMHVAAAVQPWLEEMTKVLIESLPKLTGKLLVAESCVWGDQSYVEDQETGVEGGKRKRKKKKRILALGFSLESSKTQGGKKTHITQIFQNDEPSNATAILLIATNIFGNNMQYSNLYTHSILVSLE